MNHLDFLKTFTKDKYVGAVAPTSNFVVKKVCSKIDFFRDITIVEYGPGSGVFTKQILKRLNQNSKLIAVETNANFVNYLRRISDKRLIVEMDDARNIQQIADKHGIYSIDYVISGIPFSFFPENVRESIVANTYSALSPSGKFLIYQYSPLMHKYLKPAFKRTKTSFLPFNLPSMFLMEAYK